MPNNSAVTVREPRDASPRDVDPRVARSTHALGQALIELIQEGDYDSITVQRILDRAGIGRATFYAHYRNKEDVLYSSYERLFSGLERLVERPSAVEQRLFPVSEFLEHLAASRILVNACAPPASWTRCGRCSWSSRPG
jgi:AcrR family transcriptional regulator